MKAQELFARRIRHANLFLEEGETIRTVSARTGSSRSSVCNDLLNVGEHDHQLFLQVRKKIAQNVAERCRRGGQATKKKRILGELDNAKD